MCASPQTENGYTKIANEIIDKFCCYRLSGEEWLVLWVILRKTYGWNKKDDAISLSQFAIYTGMKKSSIIRAIHKLVAKKLLLIYKNATSFGNMYKFNKDFDKWKPFTKKLPVVAKVLTPVSKSANGGVAKVLHTKDTITKDTITKDTIAAKAAGNEIKQVIDIFYKSINPTINWGNTTSNKAALELIKRYGIEKTLQLAGYACSVQGKNYAPTITTPYQLKEKLGALTVYAKRNQTNKIIKLD